MSTPIDTIVAAIREADTAGMVRIQNHAGGTLQLADLERRLEDGDVHLGGADLIAFRRQIDEHRRQVAANRRHEANERNRAPIAPDAPETRVEQQIRQQFEDAAARAAHRATPVGQAERQIELLERIAEALEQR